MKKKSAACHGKDHAPKPARKAIYLLFFLAAGLVELPSQAKELSLDTSPVVIAGVAAHDQGPLSDHNEHGIDLNVEFQLKPFALTGRPRIYFGTMLSFNGSTSAIVGGLNFPIYSLSSWFLRGSIGAAMHNGPLHKDPVNCSLNSDCGYGTRVLPHFGIDLGYRIDPQSAVSLYLDHMSHKWVFSGENEGLDHTALRYMRAF